MTSSSPESSSQTDNASVQSKPLEAPEVERTERTSLSADAGPAAGGSGDRHEPADGRLPDKSGGTGGPGEEKPRLGNGSPSDQAEEKPGSLGDYVARGAEQVAGAAQSIIDTAVQSFRGGDLVTQTAGQAIDEGRNVAGNAPSVVQEVARDTGQVVLEVAKVGEQVAQGVVDDANSAGQAAVQGVQEEANSLADDAKSVASAVVDEAKSVAGSVADGVKSAVTAVTNEVKSVAGAVGDGVKAVTDEVKSVAGAVSGDAKTVAGKVSDGVHAAGHAVSQGVQAAGHALSHGVHIEGQAVGSAAHQVGQIAHDVARNPVVSGLAAAEGKMQDEELKAAGVIAVGPVVAPIVAAGAGVVHAYEQHIEQQEHPGLPDKNKQGKIRLIKNEKQK